MNCDRPESCFVCSRNVLSNGVLLSMGTTAYTKTSFLTKLMQLLGEAFMVVIREDDKICLRCVELINQADKFEQDLRKTQTIIRGFLNEKYDLNEEVEFSSLDEVHPESKESACSEEGLLLSAKNYKYCLDGGNILTNKCSNNKGESFEIEESAFDVIIKSEPMLNSDQNGPNSNDSQNIRVNCDNNISEPLLKKLLENNITLKEKHLLLDPNSVEGNQIAHESEVLQPKKEIIVLDDKENNDETSLSQSGSPLPANEIKISEKSATALIDDHLHLDERISFFDKFSSIKQVKNVSKSNDNSVKPSMRLIGKECEAELLNTSAGNKLSQERKGKMGSCILNKQKSHKRKRKKVTNNSRKLRPILPKVSNINEVMSSIYILEQSNPSVCNKELNEHENKLSISELNQNPYILTEESDAITKIPLAVDLACADAITPKATRKRKYKKRILTEESDAITKIPLTVDLACADAITPKATRKRKYKKRILTEESDAITKIPLAVDLACADAIAPKATRKRKYKKRIQEPRIYLCSFCPKSFKKRASMRYHEVKHTGNYSHYCDFCKQGFATRPQLEHHRRIHTKEMIYMCDVCGKKFNSKGTWWIHRKWHDNPYPYKCEECGKPYRHSSRLAVHRRKHTGERPYKCSYCTKTFNQLPTLKRHLILHTGQYPFHCEACDKGFTTRDKYNHHLAKKHDIIVEKCSKDPKDYKMAVQPIEQEVIEVDTSVETDEFDESRCQMTTSGKPEFDFSNSSEDSNVEVISPPPSIMNDDSFSEITWLAEETKKERIY